ncbi:hypothetical protein ACFE04_019181 [Oxalis oulophora]
MAKRTFKQYIEQELGMFPQFVIFAVLEWLLIIALFVDGFLAFFSNVFAKFFELRIPCLLCTRLDHLLVHRNPDFYYNESICETHKKNISSLAYCHIHKKLSDIRNMCEGCLLSFATEKESDCDTYKSLIGILHKDLELLVDDDQEIQLALPSGKGKDDIMQTQKSSCQNCSCCGDPLKAITAYAKPKSSELSYDRAPSLRRRPSNLEIPNIRYKELTLTPKNESEIPEDEDGSHSAFKHLGDEEDKTPRSKFFGISLADSAANSPRWTIKQRKSPLEKTEFSQIGDSISTEGQGQGSAGPSDADGDSMYCHLNRQVRLDRKSLIALYMELDEERSASNIAANNAMAMITRLQAEKAAVQMEALQYQRMMDEQADFDEEAMQTMRDELAKREEEVRELEDELEAYRNKYGDIDDNMFDELAAYDGNLIDEGNRRKASLMKELSRLQERVEALEADGFTNSIPSGTEEEGARILTEICHNLQKLQQYFVFGQEN